VTVAVGLGVRALADGAFAKCAGDALYTVLVYLVVVLIAPGTRPLPAAGIALGFSWAVEFLQIAGVPAALRPLLGSTFNAPDLFWYAVGAAGCWAVTAARRAARGAVNGPVRRAIGTVYGSFRTATRRP
jgi:hypothetical protein